MHFEVLGAQILVVITKVFIFIFKSEMCQFLEFYVFQTF